MTQEEKAKAYDEALKKARFYHGNCPSEPERKKLERMFPVLRESEDERIRKEMIDFLKSEKAFQTIDLPISERWIAYLEKQKEQKPKHFELKVGKWYICHRAFCCRADHLTVKEGERFMCEKDGVVKGFVIKEPEKYFKECSAPAPIEDEQKEPHYTKRNALFDECVENCDPKVMKSVSDEIDEMLEKEQKPLKVGENAYFDPNTQMWFIKKEQKPAEVDESTKRLNNNWMRQHFDDYKERNTATINGEPIPTENHSVDIPLAEWSEEDEKMLRTIISDGSRGVELDSKQISWLKSLRPSWKPSEEQKEAL